MTTIGNLIIWAALTASLLVAMGFFSGAASGSAATLKRARGSLVAVAGMLTLAVLILYIAIFSHDFSFQYVADYSSIHTPPLYLFSVLWAGNSGSLLFWAWLLSLFAVLVVFRKSDKYPDLVPYAAGVMMIIEAFFLLLLAVKVSPFIQLPNPPPDGANLNLLLQNVGMVFHPPALLAGYVIFAVPFAFAVAALITKNNSEDWLVACRKYAIFAWLLLGIGNIIGGWWAYVELGWGGYWAWDPVENAGLMPWLIATAFLHSSIMQRKRGSFRVWSLLLIIITYTLVIFGTFLTRSNILNSVHTFPDMGLTSFFVVFIALILFIPLGLLYSRFDDFRGESSEVSVFSKEYTFAFNNFLLVGITAVVLIGTTFPAISEALTGQKIGLDASFFNKVNGPLLLAVIVLAGICTIIGWKKNSAGVLLRGIIWPLAASVLISAGMYIGFLKNWPAIGFIAICSLVLCIIIRDWAKEALARSKNSGENVLVSCLNLVRKSGQRYGGYTVHLGIILIAIGVIGSSFYSQETETSVKKGELIKIGQYTLRYDGLTVEENPDKDVVTARLSVSNSGRLVAIVTPQKLFQAGHDDSVTEVVVRSNLIEDLYVILQGWENGGETAYFKVLINPLVSWIWIGGIVFSIGGLITFWPFRVPSPAPNPVMPATREIEQEVEKQIAKRRKQKGSHCPSCGGINQPDAKFCATCGGNLSGGCRACGRTNKQDARFCADCGADLHVDER